MPSSDPQLQQQLAEMAQFPEMNPCPVVRMDRTGTVLLANSAAHRFFGDGALEGKRWVDLCPGMTPQIWEQVLTDAPPHHEATVNGVIMQFTHVHPQSGDFMFAFGADVTENRRAENQLSEQAAILREIVRFPEMNPGPVVRTDLDGNVLRFNSAARAVFGDSLEHGNWLTICNGVDRATWDRVLAASGPIPVEAHIADHDYSFAHRREVNGQFVFIFGSDITERKVAEHKVAEQAATLAEIARFPEMNPGPVFRMDTEATIIMDNAAAREVFGEALVGRCWKDLCPGMTESKWREILSATDIVSLEAHRGDKDYVFAHRRDPGGRLVFVYGADVTQQKRVERALRQADKMATLGTLAAGVAHELNNPAAATRRAAEQLAEAFARLEQAQLALDAAFHSEAARTVMPKLDQRAREHAVRPSDLDALTRSDRENELEDWLDGHSIDDPLELAPALVGMGLTAVDLDAIASSLDQATLASVITWTARAFPVYSLLNEIRQGSSRISEIVGALKSYSYLGQAPVQNVNIHEGLDNTLVILRSKLKQGINVTRDYGADVPLVEAYGGELNQVWTNILDNAADAMNGKGEIVIRTRKNQTHVIVEIEDNGPGIPADVQSRIFDPFYTTKPQGKGTGLGLSTSYNIITEKHKGSISVESQPGKTRFTVRLPVAASS